ncbi:MAG TPA: S41 family peptidase [Kiritimatiellia bacterium]|nr:S41 family peptidase [Kiritimatiellia bacterium]
MTLRHIGKGLSWFALGCILGVNLLLVARLYSKEVVEVEPEDPFAAIELFTRALEQIRLNYVESDKTTYRELIESALQGMLQSLDPHSAFLDQTAYDDIRDDTRGQFGGVGIVITLRDGSLTVVNAIEGTPGFHAGLMSGDRIVEVDGESTEGFSMQDAVKRLRGEPGTTVKLKIQRATPPESLDFTIQRADIQVPVVRDTRMLDDRIGYTRIATFNDLTAGFLDREITKLLDQGMKALVLDLRGNPGGLLSSAIDVAQRFLPRREVIVSTRSRRDEQVFTARGRLHYTFPMVVLVNGGSASAAEIVAGALQDHRRAILVGEKTFGKGSVQSVLPLDDGTALRLTTALYYTPSKRAIHDRGIEPDILVPLSPEQWRALMFQRAREENPDLPLPPGMSGDPVADDQIDRALDVLRGYLTFSARR